MRRYSLDRPFGCVDDGDDGQANQLDRGPTDRTNPFRAYTRRWHRQHIFAAATLDRSVVDTELAFRHGSTGLR